MFTIKSFYFLFKYTDELWLLTANNNFLIILAFVSLHLFKIFLQAIFTVKLNVLGRSKNPNIYFYDPINCIK